MKIVGLASLYNPLEFLSNRIKNLNQCNMDDVLIYFADCSPEPIWKHVKSIIQNESKFNYRMHHFKDRTTLYYTWTWIIKQVENNPNLKYFVNTNVDDIYHPEYFTKVSKFMDDNKHFKITSVKWKITHKKGQVWPPECDNVVVPDVSKTLGHFPMWRAGLHKHVGYFNQDMVAIGDADFWIRVRDKFGADAIGLYNDEWLACYLEHGNNLYHTAKVGNVSGEGHDWSIIRQQDYYKRRVNQIKKAASGQKLKKD